MSDKEKSIEEIVRPILERSDRLQEENARLRGELTNLSNKLNTLSVRANTYGPSFPPTYADALWNLAKEAREALAAVKGEE